VAASRWAWTIRDNTKMREALQNLPDFLLSFYSTGPFQCLGLLVPRLHLSHRLRHDKPGRKNSARLTMCVYTCAETGTGQIFITEALQNDGNFATVVLCLWMLHCMHGMRPLGRSRGRNGTKTTTVHASLAPERERCSPAISTAAGVLLYFACHLESSHQQFWMADLWFQASRFSARVWVGDVMEWGQRSPTPAQHWPIPTVERARSRPSATMDAPVGR